MLGGLFLIEILSLLVIFLTRVFSIFQVLFVQVEHWENAQITGRLAGANMTKAEKTFWYVS